MITESIEILLVEDEKTDEELILRALSNMRIANRIFVVRDGQRAVELIAQNYLTLKLILLDIKLPSLDGLQILDVIKRDDRTRTIPTVALTSSSHEIDIIQSYKLGVNSYIVKPVDFEQFTEAIRQVGLYWLLLNIPPVHQ